MSAPDPADRDLVIDLRSPGDGTPERDCPSCGASVPPRRLFCTDYCRTALHRIRRTDADITRLRGLLEDEADEGQATLYARQIQVLERRAAARSSRLADYRSAHLISIEDTGARTDISG